MNVFSIKNGTGIQIKRPADVASVISTAELSVLISPFTTQRPDAKASAVSKPVSPEIRNAETL